MAIKRIMLCAHCKGDDVVVDAWAEWSLEKQEWVLRTAFDNAYCIDCEEACDVDEVETHDPVSWVSPRPVSDAMGCLVPEHLGDFDEIKGCLPAGPLSMDNVEPGIVMIDEYIEPIDPEIKKALAKLLLEPRTLEPGPIIAEHVIGADMKDKNNG